MASASPLFVHHSVTIPSPACSPPSLRRSPKCAEEMAKILIIEDDERDRPGDVASSRRRRASTPSCVANGETGLARLRYERPDVCVLDLMLPGVDGWKRDRASPRRGHRHADRRRQRARHRARPGARAGDRRRRLPRQAVLDEGARRACRGCGTPRHPRAGSAPRRGDRDRGAPPRPAGTCRPTSTGTAPT